MTPFAYTRAKSVNDAVSVLGANQNAKFLGGGTNLLDLMKMGVEQPQHLVDITKLPSAEITEHSGRVRIGAMARNRDVAAHRLIREHYPVLSEALLAGASPQIRNMATVGGNLMQRTRCYYFYDPTFTECNKRTPGSGCAAIQGYNRIHAILGGSDQCIAVHPSDMAVAMSALGAEIHVTGPRGERVIPIDEFYKLPGTTPQLDTTLRAGELITAVELPAIRARRSHYLKVRDRNSYAFALVSAAVVLDLDDRGAIHECRIALGGVAHKPWRVPDAERAMVSRAPNDQAFQDAAEALLHGAKPYRHNTFKVELARRTIVRALASAAALA